MKKPVTLIIISLTALMLLQGCALTEMLPRGKKDEAKTEEVKRKTVIRVVEDENGETSIIVNYEDQMYKYPEGIEFETIEEADEYLFRRGGGGNIILPKPIK